MPQTDRYNKVVLTILCLGVWGSLLRPLITTSPAWAQKPSTSSNRYGVLVPTEKGWSVSGNGRGKASLNITELATGLAAIPRTGWKLHSVTSDGFQGGYVVIVQK